MSQEPPHKPNRNSLSRRIASGFAALALSAYGVYGIFVDDLLIPGRSSLHLTGLSAWIMGLALLCAAIHLALVLVDHFDKPDYKAPYELLQTRLRRLGWAFAGLALALHLAGVRFPKPSEITTLGWVIGGFVFLAIAALGWIKPQAQTIREAAGTENQRQSGTSWRASVIRIVASLLLIFGALLVLRDIVGLMKFGRITQPVIASFGIGMTSLGVWLWMKARYLDLLRVSSPGVPGVPRGRAWLPLQIGLVLILCVWGSRWINFAPRDGSSAPTVKATPQEIAERAAAPAFTLDPDDFRSQTFSTFNQMLRTAGHKVRCYGDLRPNEKLYPSVTQICWPVASAAWGLPVENMSFHFAGEKLESVRVEFQHDQWPRLRQWLPTLSGEDAGTFGNDGDGNEIIGRRVGDGLLMTAPPSPRSTILMLWESKRLLVERCSDGDETFTPKQRVILCAR